MNTATDADNEIVETTYYVNVVTEGMRPGREPECVTDEHLDTEDEARQFALDYLRDNPDVIHAEISAYYVYSDDTACGSDNPISYVDRNDLVNTDRPS